jgi:hypothetical protein
MQILKLIGQTMVELLKRVRRLPQEMAATFKRRRQQLVLHALEAERLDRIRNPSKYLGKF